MSDSATEITNLLYRYAEMMDSGDLVGAAELFRHARVKMRGSTEPIEGRELLTAWRRRVRLYPCGTPRTKHVVTNAIIEVDDEARRASSRSYYTVFQATDELPLQVIAAGRYHDEFERADGTWRFTFRDYSMLDLVGNLEHHLTTNER